MADGLRDRLTGIGRWILRFERREVRAFHRWIETTANLVHLTVLVAIPLLLGVVTALSNTIGALPYLLFPPLASGSYTLFADPDSRDASPRRFVGGLTAGAFCGWLALEFAIRFWYRVPASAYEVSAGAVALGLFLTGVVTWALDVEVASAFSTALLVHVTGTSQLTYVGSVAASSALVAGTFYLWREHVYKERAHFLYESIKGDDHVLVPMIGDHDHATAMLAARLAAAHDAGKVVLLDIVADKDIAETKRTLIEEATDSDTSHLSTTSQAPKRDPDPVDDRDYGHGWTRPVEEEDAVEVGDVSHDWTSEQIQQIARDRTAGESATALEERAQQLETAASVPCEVVVAVGRGAQSTTISRVAHEANCDLIAVPYETDDGRLATYIRELFRGDTDVLVHHSHDGRTRWNRVMVPVRKASDTAHSMLDFATRLVGSGGAVSVCHCITSTGNGARREAETMLANLVETFDGPIETRVSAASIQEFLTANDSEYDLIILGSSHDRSAVSRLVSPPTVERLPDVETDFVIVDRNY